VSRNAYLASGHSLLVPGLGQVYSGRSDRGAAILIATIIVGNLNAIWLSLHAEPSPKPEVFWAYALPRILHDLFAAYGGIFWIWQVVDAYQQAQQRSPYPPADSHGREPTALLSASLPSPRGATPLRGAWHLQRERGRHGQH
jgi:hypothetical protein